MTYRFLSLANANQTVSKLSALARPYLLSIRDVCNEAIFLSTYDVDQMTVIDFADSTHAIRLVGGTGGNIPVHNTSTGKACLARLPNSTVNKIISLLEKRGFTLNRNQLSADLEKVKRDGFCVIEGEWAEELSHIGCAITDQNDHPIGGIGVSIPNFRYANVDVNALGELLMQSCDEISQALCTNHETASN